VAICEHLEPADQRIGPEKPRVLSTHYVKCHLYDENQGNEG
jgi:hypothetical protein